MPIFRRGTRPPKVQLITDAAVYDEPLRRARDEVVATGRWEPAAELLAATGRDWDRRAFRVDVLGGTEQSRAWLDDWLQARPAEPDALAVAAAAGIDRAWEARGGGWAKDTPAEAFERFFRLLGRAQQFCEQAIAAAPDDPTPWVPMLWLAVGQERDEEFFQDAWKELTARDPHHRAGHNAALQYLSEKWHGSHEKMFRFARSAAADAPAGSPLALLPLQAHAEFVLRESSKQPGSVPPQIYWGSAERLADIDHVLHRWLGAGGGGHALEMHDRSVLAFALSLAGRLPEAAEQFTAMGHQVYEYPWYYLPGRLPELHRKAMRAANP